MSAENEKTPEQPRKAEPTTEPVDQNIGPPKQRVDDETDVEESKTIHRQE